MTVVNMQNKTYTLKKYKHIQNIEIYTCTYNVGFINYCNANDSLVGTCINALNGGLTLNLIYFS